MTRPSQPVSLFDSTTVSSPQRPGAAAREVRLSKASSALVCLARLLGRLAAKACAEDHSNQVKETEYDQEQATALRLHRHGANANRPRSCRSGAAFQEIHLSGDR